MKSAQTIKKNLFFLGFCLSLTALSIPTHAGSRKIPVGKPVYCDTSAGRTVLNNGNYSKLYCRNHAIMDLQTIHGCCSWAGGILAVRNGGVICRNGTLSAVCSLQTEDETNENFDGTVSLDDM